MLLLVIVALALGLARRLMFGWGDPLGSDETFTGAIALNGSVAELIGDVLSDVVGPVHYTFIWAWEKLFGASNVSLRAPSLIFALATPLLILAKGHPDRQLRFIWAALMALWIPSFYYAAEARNYTLVLFLAAAQVIAFLRMMAEPTLGRAVLWGAISALLILTHYHALVVTGLQGLGYLARHRGRALRTWPAALAFVPVVLWLYFHLATLLVFSRPGVAWQRLLTIHDLRALPSYLAGLPKFSAAAVLAVGAGLMWEVFRGARGGAWRVMSRPEAVAGLASIGAILIVFGMGFIRPNFTSRYLFAFMPGALFAVAVWARAAGRRWRFLPMLVVGAAILGTLRDIEIRLARGGARQVVSWEAASADLGAAGARRLVFFADGPSAFGTAPQLQAKIGTFFFAREGKRVPTFAVNLARRGLTTDPNPVLLDTADQPRDAIIWIFGRNEEQTFATSFPPSLSKRDRTLRCRDYGSGYFVVLTCFRTAGANWPDSRQDEAKSEPASASR